MQKKMFSMSRLRRNFSAEFETNIVLQLLREGMIKNMCSKELNREVKMVYSAKNNEDYLKKLKEQLENYKDSFVSEGNLISDVKSICDGIIEVLELSIAGLKDETKRVEAEDKLVDLLKEYIANPFGMTELDRCFAFRGIAPFDRLHDSDENKETYTKMMEGDLSFFRGRTVDKDDCDIVEDLKDIVSLPYSKRDLSGDMRFSSKGQICLYLGTTSYVCSRECKWDEDTQNLYMSAIKFNDKGKKLKILNLAVWDTLMDLEGDYIRKGVSEDERKKQNLMIRTFPFVIATSYVIETSNEIRIKKYNEKVKYEYLLSQALIRTVKRIGIDGIAYLSGQTENPCISFPQEVNLAIPMYDIGEEKEYSDLYDCFEITKPVLVNDSKFELKSEESKHSYINSNYERCGGETTSMNSCIIYEGKNVLYGDIFFSQWDDWLVNQKYYKFEYKR